MLPRLPHEPGLQTEYREFLDDLTAGPFCGEVRRDFGSRLVQGTDNSVYQVLPQAVVLPRSHEDVLVLARLAGSAQHHRIVLSPRGGGTGTNGQSLTDGIVVDLSKFMTRVLELNIEEGWVRVEPGVVLDQLNAHLATHGLFFPPTVAPSDRATLGGMIATNACGKGSRIYGRTSDHVLELRVVLLDGAEWRSRRLSEAELAELKARDDRLGSAARLINEIVTGKRDLIAARFPQIPRFLTGYDLAHVRDGQPGFDLNPILAGSEGTLAFVTEARLRVTEKPSHRRLVAIRYAHFDDALASATAVLRSDPLAIETIDDTIIGVARQDEIWDRVGPLLKEEPGEQTAAVNLVEFCGNDPAVIEEKTRALTTSLDEGKGQPGHASGYVVAADEHQATALWALRKKGVGLLGNVPGDRRPVAFVEDSAVPAERLAEYIGRFRALLEAEGLTYGMYGHVDVGCLHVRPALNLRDPGDELLLRKISDQVLELVREYGGVMWAEHGKGYRSEYSPRFFGDELFGDLCRIKEAFDPNNQLNPGKLAVPASSDARLVSVDAVKRGSFDRQIATTSVERYSVAVHCNGNGACFQWNSDSVMCPSYLVTRDRVHSPKGRAALLREWLRQMSNLGHDPALTVTSGGGRKLIGEPRDEFYDFSHELFAALDGCLSCRACATLCPVRVDVGWFKSEFLELYHRRYRRPAGDFLMAALEFVLPWLAVLPAPVNWMTQAGWSRSLLRRLAGIVDVPLLSRPTLLNGLRGRGQTTLDVAAAGSLAEDARGRSVILLQDAFTSFYEAPVVLDIHDLLSRLGFTVHVVPYRPNGKAMHVKGFLGTFHGLVRKNGAWLRRIARSGVPLVGIDPAVTLTYRDEYPSVLGGEPGFDVRLLQEWLADRSEQIANLLAEIGYQPPENNRFRLMGHCTERTLAPASQTDWQRLFRAFGLELELEDVGCCGMCGVFGHEARHEEESRRMYGMSWQRRLPADPEARRRYLAPGYSCRSQVKRVDGEPLRHPASALLELINGLLAAPPSRD